MLTKDGPKVLEFNARFGDPETQVYLTRLENDLVELLDASVYGTLAKHELKWSPHCFRLRGDGLWRLSGRLCERQGYHAAWTMPPNRLRIQKCFTLARPYQGGQIVTNGGRVLGVTALGHGFASAQDCAYAAVEKIHFDGAQFRRDIGRRALQIVRKLPPEALN